MPLLTNWQVIGTAGSTIDDREITEQDLIDAAETYDHDEYYAVINAEHELSWFGNFGLVDAVRLGKDKKQRTVLEALLEPNHRLVEMNRNGQRLFSSMELKSNYAGTGRTYLTGLAVTDQPASLGTSRLKMFSRSGNQESAPLISAPVQFSIQDDSKPNADEQENRFFARLKSFLSNPAADPDGTTDLSTDSIEDDEMNADQFKQLLSAVQTLGAKLPATTEETPAKPETDGVTAAQFSTLTEQVTALTANVEKLANPGTAQEETPAADDSAAKYAQLSEQLTTLTTQFTALQQEKPDARFNAGTGAESGGGFV
ncbi:MAG: GPO family capsid scaffolding protein [Motiliproteus sp.]